MAGKEIIFIAALFVVVQSHPDIFLNRFSCPSMYSLRPVVEKNECTTKQDCSRGRYLCCENQYKVNVCTAGIYTPFRNLDSNKKAAVESESTNNLDKSTPVPTASTDNDNDIDDD